MAPLQDWLTTLLPNFTRRALSSSSFTTSTQKMQEKAALAARAINLQQARRLAYEATVSQLHELRASKAHHSPTPTNPINRNYKGGSGSAPAAVFNNKAILALFATLGAAMVLAALWFFFWSKNGGFHFEEGDWEDYKSTVLRRKGPDGRTLTNATKSTKLGGSTIAGTQRFKWAKNSAQSVVSYDKKGRKGIKAQRGWGKSHSVYYSDDFTSYGDDDTKTRAGEMRSMREAEEGKYRSLPQDYDSPREKGRRDRDVQDYKREKPARVGGLNRIHDGSHVDATNTDFSDTNSDLPNTPSKARHSSNNNNNRASHASADRSTAERRARTEAAKMERRWKREAEEAAAALARESSPPAASSPHPPSAPKHRSAPVTSPTKPSPAKQRDGSRSISPKKRDFSYAAGDDSEVFSGTASSGRRTTSYFDEYRPRDGGERGYESDFTGASGSRGGSPVKKAGPQGARGYRRGGEGSGLD